MIDHHPTDGRVASILGRPALAAPAVVLEARVANLARRLAQLLSATAGREPSSRNRQASRETMMKHSTMISLTTALSIAACQDSTAPEPMPDSASALANAPLATVVDSSAAWASFALDDAATRLLSGFDDSAARRDLERALRSLSLQLVHRGRQAETNAYRDAADAALSRLRALTNDAAIPDLDAIGMAIEGSRRER